MLVAIGGTPVYDRARSESCDRRNREVQMGRGRALASAPEIA